MANYVKQTWTDAVSALSAARMAVIEQGIFDAHFQPCARVYNNANQSIPNNAATTVVFNSERFDTDNIHDTVTNNSRLTCKTAGKYLYSATVMLAVSTSSLVLTIVLNGTTSIGVYASTGTALTSWPLSATGIYDLAVNDYLEVTVYQLSGAALNSVASSNISPEFMMVRVG